jgi:hypothetical protein
MNPGLLSSVRVQLWYIFAGPEEVNWRDLLALSDAYAA